MSVKNLVPGFFLRLETQCPSIKVQIFKAVLRFIFKILCKPEDSALYQCFIMQTKNRNEDSRYNWMMQVKQLFSTHGLVDDFDQLTKEDKGSLRIAKDHLQKNWKIILAKFTQATIQQDIIEMNNSSRFPYFKTIKTHIARSDFLTCNLTFSEIRIIQQLRTGIPRMRVKKYIIELNGIWNLWKREGRSASCLSCMGEIEDFYHVMYECVNFNQERLKYLHKYLTKDPIGFSS